jgi:hypothetical protein
VVSVSRIRDVEEASSDVSGAGKASEEAGDENPANDAGELDNGDA